MLLAKDGIFPITTDAGGNPLSQLPASGFQFPGTIQGEGKLTGIPSLFVRLAGCNLHCCWRTPDNRISHCDTAYAAYHLEETHTMSPEKIYQTILHNTSSIRHIVITGGEPLLQAKELKLLCCKLKQTLHFHITIETNATLFEPEVAQYIDLFSLSPKLSSSQSDAIVQTPDPKTIQHYIDYARHYQKDFQLKFVFSRDIDILEIKRLLSNLTGWKNEDILLMPLGENIEILRINISKTLENCIRNGWRYCDRLHISLFGDKTGV